jgi:2-methylcitrate dehydratase PrpD
MEETKNSGAITSVLSNFIVGTKAADIPSDVYENAKVEFLDWLGCAVAGADDLLVAKLIHYADTMGGNEHATVLRHNIKKTVTQAAIINGAASHVLDYDDTSTIYTGHASVGMFPAFLALSEWKELSGSDFLTGHIIAFKVAATIGAIVGDQQYKTGWHTTSTIGHFSSAAGCARLLGLNKTQVASALGLAGTLSSGLKIVFGTMTKAFHAGNACQAGIRAALLAQDNFTCAPDLLEGTDGYLQAHQCQVDEKELMTLGKTWGFDGLAQKYHASCHFTHSAIESFLSIVNENKLSQDNIKSIKVYSSQLALNAAGKTNPATALEGKFSIPYCVANALIRGDTGIGAFTDEKVNDPGIKKFMKKISLFLNESLEPMEAKIEVETNDGQMYAKTSNIFREIPPLDVKKSKIRAKFLDLTSSILGDDKAESLADTVFSLERISNMKKFVAGI